MTMRTFLNLWNSHPGARFALAIAAIAVWLAWSLGSAPPVRHALPAQSSPAQASSAPIPAPAPTVYTCITRGHLPRFSDRPCPPGVDLQMVEIPPPSAASYR